MNQSSTSVSILFDQSVSAFGADFTAISDVAENVVMSLAKVGGGTDTVTIPELAKSFFGFFTSSSTAYTSITFSNSGASGPASIDGWGMDNLSAKNFSAPVPEASAAMVWSLIGLVGIGWRRRR